MLEMTYLQDFLLSVYNCTSLWRGIVVGACSLYLLRKAAAKTLLYSYRKLVRGNFPPIEHQEGIVYLYAFPRCITKQMVNLSPFAIKLESWLRLKKIKYQFVDSMTFSKATTQIPYIVYNNEEYAESNLIIDFLNETFNLDATEGLNDEQQAVTRAFTKLAEESLAWTQFLYRYVYNCEGFKKIMGWPFLPKMWKHRPNKYLSSSVLMRATKTGVGRLSQDQVMGIGKDDVRAISKYLGNKKFMHGDNITLIDCTLFGQLCQIIYIDLPFPHKEILDTECTNIKPYVDRLKEHLWPDWYTLADQELFET